MTIKCLSFMRFPRFPTPEPHCSLTREGRNTEIVEFKVLVNGKEIRISDVIEKSRKTDVFKLWKLANEMLIARMPNWVASHETES